jgi:hypothetical protein
LKETWLNKLKEIIKTNFAETADSAKLASFNLNVANKSDYESSDLKRFLMQQRFIMEDTLLEMTQKSVHRFVDCIISFLPISCEVKDTGKVENVYYTAEQIKALGAPKPKFPLFQIDVILNDQNEPEFSHGPEAVVESILKTFDHGLSALEQVVLLEQKLLPQLFKSNQKLYLKVPVKPDEMPVKPDPSKKQLLPDPNTWIYEAFDKLRNAVQQIVDPLNQYLDTLKKYKNEYSLNP